MTTLQMKSLKSEIEPPAAGSRSFVTRITTNAIDRDREVLLPEGLDASDFEKNPIVFYGHDYENLDNVVGTVTAMKREKDHWKATVKLAERPEEHEGPWAPDTILSLIQQEVIRGVSVGFEPVQTRRATDADRKEFGDSVVSVVSRWKLFELSIAPLPANQDALIEAVSKGVVSLEQIQALPPEPVTEAAVEVAVKRRLHPVRVMVDILKVTPVTAISRPNPRKVKAVMPNLQSQKALQRKARQLRMKREIQRQVKLHEARIRGLLYV